MGQVLVITSGKGGVGKTTVTANLGVSFANLGRRVCLLDADIGLKNLDVLLGLENRIIYTIMDVISDRVSGIDALVRHKTNRNLFLLPASQVATKEMVHEEDMKKVIGQLRNEFDFVIVDSPAGIESGFRNAVVGADTAIVVTNPEYPSVSDADRVVGLLEKSGKSEDHILLIINRYRDLMSQKKGMLSIEDILKTLALQLVGIIPDSEEIIVASNRGIPATMEGSKEIHQIFGNIARRIMGHKIPIKEDYRLSRPTFWTLFRAMFRR